MSKKSGIYVKSRNGSNHYKTYTSDKPINGKHLCYEIDKETQEELVPQVRVLISGSKIFAFGHFD